MTNQAITWDKNSFEALFQRNDKALERALVLLYNRQTTDEKAAGTTSHSNNKGFTGTDAQLLSSFAQRVLRGLPLSERQRLLLRRKNKHGYSILAKYHRQLREEVQAKAQRAA